MVHHSWSRPAFSPLTVPFENTVKIVRFKKEEDTFFNEKDLDLRIPGYTSKKEREKVFTALSDYY